MFDDATIAFLESGCALTVGTVDSENAPFATRAWGLTVLGGTEARLLLDADDAPAVSGAAGTRAIAITAVNVPTLRSTQVKGRVLRVEPATDADRDRADRFCDEFFGDIAETEKTPRHVIEHIRPADYCACIVTIEERYDQTPGPGAGAPIESERT